MVIVQTTRRPQEASYIAHTLASIGDVGARKKIVVSDGPLPDGFVRPDDWMVVEFTWRGARATGWRCLQLALEAGADDLVLLQDDVVVCEGGGELLDRAPVPESCSAVTFFSGQTLPGLQPKATGPARYIVLGASGTAQALKLPRRALEWLVARDPFAAPNISPREPHLFDDALFAHARESPWPHVAHLVPNPVRHVGEISACGTRRIFQQPWSVRRGDRFPGDVASLPIHAVPYRSYP
jgi:hypothetical protein